MECPLAGTYFLLYRFKQQEQSWNSTLPVMNPLGIIPMMKKSAFLSTALIVTGLLFTTAGCSSPQGDMSETPSPPPDTDQYFGLPSGDLEVIESEKQDFVLQTVVSGLETPWGMAFLPGGEVLITERDGRLRIVRDGKLQAEPVSGVPDVYARGQGGLLDLELHPQYEENGWIYISYSYPGDGGGNTALMRTRLDGDSLTDREVLFQGTPVTGGGRHFGSRIEFDRQGYLYVTIGERGTMDNAQNLGNTSGNVLRLNDDGSIPSDNPFIDTPGARPEVFTYGNRNPQGLTMHPETGEIWAHEHGPRGGDEINILRAGNNYGWPEITFGIDYDGSIISDDTAKAGMEQPVHYWDPSIAPSGMDFYNGDRYPDWKGNLFVGALKFSYLDRIELEGEKVVHEEPLLEGIGRVRDVKQGPDGYLYILEESGGRMLRLVPAEEL